jgi:hypothetical protein
LALKLTLLANVPAAEESRRTTTGWLAPGASENEPPETMLNGDPTLAEPTRLAVATFFTVNEMSVAVPTVVVPKSMAVVGLTVMSAPQVRSLARALALEAAEVDRSDTTSTSRWP